MSGRGSATPLEASLDALAQAELQERGDVAAVSAYRAFEQAFARTSSFEERIEAFLQGVCALWLQIASRGPEEIARFPREVLSATHIIKAMSLLLEAISAGPASKTAALKKGGFVMAHAIGTAGNILRSSLGEFPTPVFDRLCWFGDEICEGKWKIKEPWSHCREIPPQSDGSLVHPGPLGVAAYHSKKQMVAWILSKGISANDDFVSPCKASPIMIGFHSGSIPVLEQLCAAGADPTALYGDGFPPIQSILSLMSHDQNPTPLQIACFKRLVELKPELLSFEWVPVGSVRYSTLEGAVLVKAVSAVKILLDAGAKIRHELREVEERGQKAEVWPTVVNALRSPALPVLKLLLEEHHAMEGWQERYSPEAKGAIARALGSLAVATIRPTVLNADAVNIAACFDAFLATGFNWSFDETSTNTLVPEAFRSDPQRSDRLLLTEDEIISLLRRFKSHGFNVKDFDGPNHPDARDLQLSFVAVHWDVKKVLAFAIDEVGCRTDALCKMVLQPGSLPCLCTPLLSALYRGKLEIARQLLLKHRAEVCYADRPSAFQPLAYALNAQFSDADCAALVRIMLEKKRDLLRVGFLREEASDDDLVNPLLNCVQRNKPLALETLVADPSLPGLAELCSLAVPCRFPDRAGRLVCIKVTPAVFACTMKHWACLSLLLRIPSLSVLKEDDFPLPALGTTDARPSVASLVAKWAAVGGPQVPSRTLVAAVAARAAAEREGARVTVTTTDASLGCGIPAPSNAFEDVVLAAAAGARAVARADKKKKAKKRAQKKKAKAKKKAAAADAGARAGAGASNAAAADDDEESSGTDEDGSDDEGECLPGEENLVDTTDVPDLTAMLEEARFAKEKKEAENKKKSGK